MLRLPSAQSESLRFGSIEARPTCRKLPKREKSPLFLFCPIWRPASHAKQSENEGGMRLLGKKPFTAVFAALKVTAEKIGPYSLFHRLTPRVLYAKSQ